jgi:ribosomal protein S18 acetylase RimI-like enzyme
MSRLERVLDNTKRFEDYAEKNSWNYNDIERALDIVHKFILKKKRIIYGGMAIDLALKAKGHKGIYKEDAVPDYDFQSPCFYEDSNELADILLKAGFKNVSSINAIHVSTRRVRIDFISIADITYVPAVIYNSIPTINYKGLRVVHPSFQRLDFHRAMCTPFEKPPLEVILGRGRKDQKRFRIIDEIYPIGTTSSSGIKVTGGADIPKSCVDPSKSLTWEVPKVYLVGNVIGGIQAYIFCNWVMGIMLSGKGKLGLIFKDAPAELKKHFAALPCGNVDLSDKNIKFTLGFKCPRINRVNIITDDYEALVETLNTGKTDIHYYNKYQDDWRPRTIICQRPGASGPIQYEVFDNNPRHLPCYDVNTILTLMGDVGKATDIKICTPQYVLMYCIQKYYGGGFLPNGKLDKARADVFLKMYLAMKSIVEIAEGLYGWLQKKMPSAACDKLFDELPFFLTDRVYGSNNWSPDYIAQIRDKTNFINYVPREKQEQLRPIFGYYPDSMVGPKPVFHPEDSEFFLFDGQMRKKKFAPLVLHKTGGEDISFNKAVIRAYDDADAEDVYKIHKEIFSYSKIPMVDTEDLRKMYGWVFEDDGEIVAYLLYSKFKSPTTKDPWYYLEYIGTDPEYRNQGLGQQLIEKFHKKALKKRLPTFLGVEKDTPHTDKLLKWYSSFNYDVKREEESKKAEGVIFVTMVKPVE